MLPCYCQDNWGKRGLGGRGVGWGTGHFKITEGICLLLSLILSETTGDMFSCDVAQIITVLK